MQRPGDVRRQDALRLGSVRVDQRHEGEARRVVDEDVGRAEPLGRRGDDPLAIGRLGDVRRDRQDLRPGSLRNRRRRMFEQVPSPSRDRDPRALAGEGARDGEADACAAAGDDRDLAGEAVAAHRVPSPRPSPASGRGGAYPSTACGRRWREAPDEGLSSAADPILTASPGNASRAR